MGHSGTFSVCLQGGSINYFIMLYYRLCVTILNSFDKQGADPLNAFGGIFRVPRGGNETYPSEIVNGGR